MTIKRSNFREQVCDLWRIGFGTILIVLAAAISYLVDQPGASFGIFCGAAAGISVHWVITARASLRMEKSLVRYAKQWIENKGYIFDRNSNSFIPDVHRLLRFDAQNIQFADRDESSETMTGPYYVLKRFEKNLTYGSRAF